MTASTETLERQLLADLEGLGERIADARLCRDLYAALAGYTLHPRDGEGRLALSWRRAEELINTARRANAQPPMEGLAQSGTEGEPASDRARATLESLGWELRPRVTHRQDDAHVSDPESPPPADREPPEWERTAHAEADAERRERRL
jgi:hypothetical protein